MIEGLVQARYEVQGRCEVNARLPHVAKRWVGRVVVGARAGGIRETSVYFHKRR